VGSTCARLTRRRILPLQPVLLEACEGATSWVASSMSMNWLHEAPIASFRALQGLRLGDLVNSGAMVPSRPTRTRLGFCTILWALIPLLSFGLLALSRSLMPRSGCGSGGCGW
jgi:hypothetical protein